MFYMDHEQYEQLRLFHADNYPNWWPQPRHSSRNVEYDGQGNLFIPSESPENALHFSLLLDNPTYNSRHIRIDSHETEYGQGYLVSLNGSCRLLAAIKDHDEEGNVAWSAETFRIKLPTDEEGRLELGEAPWQTEVWHETSQNPVNLIGLLALVDQLKFEYGMSPDKAGRSKECNGIPPITGGDRHMVRHSYDEHDDEYSLEDPISIVDLNIDDEEDVPDLLYDIARHMTETVRTVKVFGKGKYFVYRSRLSNYPLGVNNRDMLDLALVFAPNQSVWYAADIRQDLEVDAETIDEICVYERQILAGDIPTLILETLNGKMATTEAHTSSVHFDDEVFITDEANAGYRLLSESA